jgi:CheY-like chemotaxis protein
MAGQILIVDDDQAQSKVTSVLLKEAGWDIRVAGSDEQAHEALKSFHPQLILMDLQVPGLDVPQFARLLKLDPEHDGVKILALTAFTRPTDAEQARLTGCDGFISKPVDARNFVELVRHFSTHPTDDSDCRDLPAEVRNGFFAEGMDRCATILTELRSGSAVAPELVRRIIRRWADVGVILGFEGIVDCAQRIEGLLGRPESPDGPLDWAFEIAYRRFKAAASATPHLPREMAAGLKGARVALAGFSEPEADRVRSLAALAEMRIGVEPVEGLWMNGPDAYDALVVNACAAGALPVLRPEKFRIPVVFIGFVSSLPWFALLPARSFDFVLAPWEAEEVLARLYRLIAKPAPARPAALPVPGEKRLRVLIADDDPDILELVTHALAEMEVDFATAADGRQALDAVRKFSPEAIVLDVDMPHLDGFEVLNRLRRNTVTANIPVILLTGYDGESDIIRGLESGANDYITKPFQPADLVNRVLKMISAAPRRSTRRAPVPASV